MIFVDASYYISLLKPTDSNHKNALILAKRYEEDALMTSQAVLGEVATVGSQRYNKEATVAFIEGILQAGTTTIILERSEFVDRTWHIFKTIKSKNVSWVDCYSLAIIEAYKIKTILAFDKDLRRLAGAQ
ncbi:MAG: PIN domain-containing protein [bacterium]|nr:PIN domain-containing protein [bacterium]